MERPGGVTALLWVLIIVGLLGLLGNGLGAMTTAAGDAVAELGQAQQEAMLEQLEGLEGGETEQARQALETQEELRDELLAANQRVRPVALPVSILGILVSGLLGLAGARALFGGGGTLLRRALWAAMAWAVAKMIFGWWQQQQRGAIVQEQMAEMLRQVEAVSGSSPGLDPATMATQASAVTLVFAALVALSKLMLYGYGLWYARQPEAAAWLDGARRTPAGTAQGAS